jgi:hypothetical protein
LRPDDRGIATRATEQEKAMLHRAKFTVAMTSICFVAAFQSPLHANDAGLIKTPKGAIAFELIGQVFNVPMAPNSHQYGYLSFIDGVDSVFAATPHNEMTARFAFDTRASTTQVIDNGKLRIVDRTGTTTIYLDDVPNGDFAVPGTFADGTPILTMSLKQQVILDLVENTFTTVNTNIVTSASTFAADEKKVRLGEVGDQFRTVIGGRVNDTGTPAGFVIAGYAVPIAKSAP